MRDFIRTNIEFDDSNFSYWKCNFMAIHSNIDNILGGFKSTGEYKGPALILEGERSVRIGKDGYTHIFPNLKSEDFVVIKDAAHWVHADQPYATAKAIGKFLKEINES